MILGIFWECDKKCVKLVFERCENLKNHVQNHLKSYKNYVKTKYRSYKINRKWYTGPYGPIWAHTRAMPGGSLDSDGDGDDGGHGNSYKFMVLERLPYK